MMRSPGRRILPALFALGASLADAGEARADFIDDLTRDAPISFCPLVYGAPCKVSMSVDLALYYQRSESQDNGVEEYFRPGVEVALLQKLGSLPLHFGASLELGAQDGEFMTGYHVVPRARLRWFPADGPVSIELAAGPAFKRSWLDVGVAGRNRVGISHELSIGVLGFASAVVGWEILTDTAGRYGGETLFYVGPRLSFLSVALAAAVGLKR